MVTGYHNIFVSGNTSNVSPAPARRSAWAANAKAADLRLSADEIAALDAAVPPAAVKGERHPPGVMKHVHR